MLLSAHTACGILIAANIADPITGSLLSLSSHYILDIIPHEPKKELFYLPPEKHLRNTDISDRLKRRTIISIFDLLLSIAIFTFYTLSIKDITFNNFLVLSIIVFFSIFPDVLTVIVVYFHNSFLKLHHKFHYDIHKIIPLSMNYLTAYSLQLFFIAILLFFTFRT